jgi:[ribosomal protein S5]-alanine N-acetyltransferase
LVIREPQLATPVPIDMEIQLASCTLRPCRQGDEADIVRHANNPNVALHLRDRFPQPYTWVDAEEWIARAARESPPLNFAIAIDDRFAGGIGLMPGSDIHRVSAEVGYWLGEAFWGRGIATCAVQGITRYAFATFAEWNRVFAYVDEDHPASIRVLEKAGLRREGRLIGSAIKQGQIRNQFLYAITRREAQRALDSRQEPSP